MVPPHVQVGTPAGLEGFAHFTSSTIFGWASWMSSRIRWSVRWRQSDTSVLLRQGCEVALDAAVPLEPRNGTPPACLHISERWFVVRRASLDGVAEVPVVGLDDLVVVPTLVSGIAGTAQLLACHRFCHNNESNTLETRALPS